jgi:hypothetical protein
LIEGAIMAKRPAADFLHRLSAKYGVVISYNDFYRNVLSGLIPATRNEKETRWLIDDADEPVIVEALDIASMPSIESKRPLASSADDLPAPARVPSELEQLIASLPAKTCFIDDTSGVRIEYVNGRWYVCQPGQPAQPISLRLCPPRPARPRASRSASAA